MDVQTSLQQGMRADHERLEASLRALLEAVDELEPPALSKAWAEIESRLLAHVDAEEKFLLPRLESHHAADVKRVLKEHEQIRRLLADLGVRADLHTLRGAVAEQLGAFLRRHADFEERAFYEFADAAFPEPEQRNFLEYLASEAKRRLNAR